MLASIVRPLRFPENSGECASNSVARIGTTRRAIIIAGGVLPEICPNPNAIQRAKLDAFFAVPECRAPVGGARSWFVLYVAPKREDRVCKDLLDLGFDVYKPVTREWQRLSAIAVAKKQAPQIVEKPLLSRYLFVELSETNTPFGIVLGVQGVLALLGTSEGPLRISPEIVGQIKARESGGEFDRTRDKRRRPRYTRRGELIEGPEWLCVGKTVRIVDGPFQGFVALISEILSAEILKVETQIFGRASSLELGVDQCSAQKVA